MSFANILVLGREGQIGTALTQQLPRAFPDARITATEIDEIDLSNNDSIVHAVRELKPDLIINTAAYTAVDKAEEEIEIAQQINGVAPGVLAEEVQRCDALLIHYSTDYVFDGTKTSPYCESDEPHPLNVYGQSKYAGETAIMQTGAHALILRTSWVYGAYGKNFLRTMLRLADERDELRIVDDQIGVPNASDTLAAYTIKLVQNKPSFLKERSGLYHFSATGQTSWFGFAQAIFAAHPQPPKLIPIATQDYPTPARRPAFGVLNTQRLAETFSLAMPDWRNGLDHCLALLSQNHSAEP
jgi:dTDP-4-dehydrorhamnose reductase